MFSQGPFFPTVAAQDALGDGPGWGNINDIEAVGPPNAAVNLPDGDTSNGLIGTGFGFNIPLGAIIRGIVFQFYKETDNENIDVSVRLTKDGVNPVGTNEGGGGVWPGSQTQFTYGSSGDLWGVAWTAAEINAGTFGAYMQTAAFAGAGSSFGQVSGYQITVYYDVTVGFTGCVVDA